MILITGATGTVGGETIRQLGGAGLAPRALVRDPYKAAKQLPAGMEFSVGDLSDPQSLAPALAGVERLMFIAPGDPHYVDWASGLYSAAKRAGVRHVVKLSALGAAADSPSELLRQHAQADALLRDSGLEHTILQPNSFHQNMLGQSGSIKGEGRFYLPLGEARQSMIDVRDVAASAVKALTEPGHAGQTYRLTGPEALSGHDVARGLSAATGKSVQYVPIPPEALRQALLSRGVPQWNAGALVELVSAFATGKWGFVTEDAAQVLGRPPLSFAKFAADFSGAFG